MFDPTTIIVPTAKPLPVILLLDVSGSMNEIIDPENFCPTGETIETDGQTWALGKGGTQKIQILNDAVRKMINSMADDERTETEYLISIITFGDDAEEHLTPTNASSVEWTDMTADGSTAMGAAFSKAKKMIDNKEVIPSRAYRPMVVLVSDGEPNDKWEKPLEALINEGRSSKCFFMAMGIGEKPSIQVLEQFISKTPFLAEVNGRKIKNTVFHATDAETIHEFFRKVTMTATALINSQNTNGIPSSNSSGENV